jgi:hypothetical protein
MYEPLRPVPEAGPCASKDHDQLADICGTTRHVEAAHTGPHGFGQKSPDTSAIPLCARHRRTGVDSYHQLGPEKFSEFHQLDIPALVARLNRKPFIRINSDTFIGSLGGEEYLLGTTHAGLPAAVRRMERLRREDGIEAARGPRAPETLRSGTTR